MFVIVMATKGVPRCTCTHKPPAPSSALYSDIDLLFLERKVINSSFPKCPLPVDGSKQLTDLHVDFFNNDSNLSAVLLGSSGVSLLNEAEAERVNPSAPTMMDGEASFIFNPVCSAPWLHCFMG